MLQFFRFLLKMKVEQFVNCAYFRARSMLMSVRGRKNAGNRLLADALNQGCFISKRGQKRTHAWFQVCGNLNVPLEGTKFGFIRSITYQDTKNQSLLCKIPQCAEL